MPFDRKTKIYFDDVQGQTPNAQAFFAAFSAAKKHEIPNNVKTQEVFKGLVADYFLYETLATSSLYVFEPELARQVMDSEVDSPTLSDFKKLPNKHVFINFTEPMPIPEAWRTEQSKENETNEENKIQAIQISWNNKEEMTNMLAEVNIPMLLSEENWTIGIWYRNQTEALNKMNFEAYTGVFPPHKARHLIRNATRNVIITEKVSENLAWDEKSIIPLAYRFLAFLSSSNINYKEVKREFPADLKLPHKMRPKRKNALLPFIKEIEISISSQDSVLTSVIPSENPKERQVVRGHSYKYWHCPSCQKITPHLEIARAELCKHCNVMVVAPDNWSKEWKWVPEHYRGTLDPTIESHQYIVKQI